MRSRDIAVLAGAVGLILGCATRTLGDGACCFCSQQCDFISEELCTEFGGVYHDNMLCEEIECAGSGSCCLPDGQCLDQTTELECDDLSGMWHACFICDLVDCEPFAPCASDAFSASSRGSIFFLPRVELRWRQGPDETYELVQDTFVELYNDVNQDVQVQLVFVNGDPPLQDTKGERDHPGWNNLFQLITLTANQPTYGSCATGEGGLFVQPFTDLDPGVPPGRPDLAGSNDRVLRGFIMGWAVDEFADGEIHWNHLAATATIVNYGDGMSWGYNGYHAASVNPDLKLGDFTGSLGSLDMDGFEFARPYDELYFSFPAAGSSVYSGSQPIVADGELTIHPVALDVFFSEKPVTTRAVMTVWNENEVKFAGMERCVSCWDSGLLSTYQQTNNFHISVLQTDVGWARIDGKAGLCDDDAFAEPVPMVGVVSRILSKPSGEPIDNAGFNLVGCGAESAYIQWGASPARSHAASEPGSARQPAARRTTAATDRGVVPVAGPSRFSSSQTGNLFVLSKVELRWDSKGELTQDTFVHLTNTTNDPVRVLLYMVNGDDPLPADKDEPAHPGWNWQSVQIDLTARQPASWSANLGNAGLGVPSWVALDPGDPPGRPDPENPGGRVLRGFIIGWAVDADCQEITGGALMADAMVLDYAEQWTWGYNAYHMKNLAELQPGLPSGTPGELHLGALGEFAPAFGQLSFAFPAEGSIGYSSPLVVAVASSDLSIHPVSVDFSNASAGPVIARPVFQVWNQNESPFSNLAACLACWDETRLSEYDKPNYWQISNLQTTMGKTRVTAPPAEECPGSVDSALLGVLATRVSIDPLGDQSDDTMVGHNLFGSGEMNATIVAGPCPGCPGDADGDGDVDLQDLLAVIANWGSAEPAGDVNNDGLVDLQDLLAVIANWGSNCV